MRLDGSESRKPLQRWIYPAVLGNIAGAHETRSIKSVGFLAFLDPIESAIASYVGITPDEDDSRGAYGPYTQSERQQIYLTYVRELLRDEAGVHLKLWKRSLKIYGYHLLMLTFAFTIAASFAVHKHKAALTNLLDFYLAHPFVAVVGSVLLLYCPPLLDILPMYVTFLFFTPLLLSASISTFTSSIASLVRVHKLAAVWPQVPAR